MLRAICGAIVVLAMLSEACRAQGDPPQMPTIGFAAGHNLPDAESPPHATLGKPFDGVDPGYLPPVRPTAWENPAPIQVRPVGNQPPLMPMTNVSYTGSYTTLPRPASDAVTVNRPGEPLLPQGVEIPPPPTSNPWLDNFSFFVGLDGSKEPIDFGLNANFGYRMAFNWGLPLWEEGGLGLQVGSALNYSQNAMRLLQYFDGTVDRWQSFTTVGLFQRTAGALRWGLAYDLRFDDSYDRMSAGQWRALLGFETNPDNEFGVWATVRDHGDSASIGAFTFSVQPISQWNFYWRHIWCNDIVTRLWVGLASEHSRFNILVPGTPQINHPFTFGGDFQVPLNDYLALIGEAHFITPNDTGTLSATLGVAWYPGSARGTARSRFAPLLPVANNSTFALDVR